MTEPKLALIGGGRHALETYYLLEDLGLNNRLVAFIQDEVEEGKQIMGIPVIAAGDIIKKYGKGRGLMLLGCIGGIADNKRVAEKFRSEGFEFFNAIHPGVRAERQNFIGKGVTIAAGSVLTTNISLGHHSIINIGCTISHDVFIGNYVNISPGVHLAGNVRIEDEVFIGVGASVIPKVVVGKGSVIAAGACVIKDVPPYSLVAGVPAVVKKTLH